jgi:Mg2+ and Co2+ transporter CorA
MDILWISEKQPVQVFDPAARLPHEGFLWIDAAQEDLADLAAWREQIHRLTGVYLHGLHLRDATNPTHPSYFDNTADYEMVIFRKLSIDAPGDVGDSFIHTDPIALLGKESLPTRAVSFFVLPNALVTVRHGLSQSINEMRQRLHELGKPDQRDGNGSRAIGGLGALTRPPAGPGDLMLRIINAMVDRYLALRTPLTQLLDYWQRELLRPNRKFTDWISLLEARIGLRRLESLCEEQYDALQELREVALDPNETVEDHHGRVRAYGPRRDALLVHINDVLEHIARVLNSARRMEASVESAVQLHFSATAHRTNEIMRVLTVITAIFMPLTLITGIFGMNVDLPLVKDHHAFWWVLGGMALLAMLMWLAFSAKSYLESRPYRMAQALARKAAHRAAHTLGAPTKRTMRSREGGG